MTSCSQPRQKVQKLTELTIEPLSLNKLEKDLISKTGVSFIEYFTLNGHLNKNEDLLMETEKYVNGKRTDETISSSGQPEDIFQDDILSFGIQSFQDTNELKLLMGFPGGLSSSIQSNNKVTMSSYGNVLNKKVKLKKNTPVYLTAWMGTTKNEMSGGIDEKDGKFPSVIKQSELAFVYKITLINRKN